MTAMHDLKLDHDLQNTLQSKQFWSIKLRGKYHDIKS